MEKIKEFFNGLIVFAVVLGIGWLYHGYKKNQKQHDRQTTREALTIYNKNTIPYWKKFLTIVAQHDHKIKKIPKDINNAGAAFHTVANLDSELASNIYSLRDDAVDSQLINFANEYAQFYRTKAEYMLDFVNSPNKQESEKRHDRLMRYIRSKEPQLVNRLNSVRSYLARQYNCRL